MALTSRKCPILTIVVLMIFLAADPALKALGRDRGAEMNAYGMAYQTMTEEIPIEMPASSENQISSHPRTRIIWLIDREYFIGDTMMKCSDQSGCPGGGGIDFGEARSLGNCSA